MVGAFGAKTLRLSAGFLFCTLVEMSPQTSPLFLPNKFRTRIGGPQIKRFSERVWTF